MANFSLLQADETRKDREEEEVTEKKKKDKQGSFKKKEKKTGDKTVTKPKSAEPKELKVQEKAPVKQVKKTVKVSGNDTTNVKKSVDVKVEEKKVKETTPADTSSKKTNKKNGKQANVEEVKKVKREEAKQVKKPDAPAKLAPQADGGDWTVVTKKETPRVEVSHEEVETKGGNSSKATKKAIKNKPKNQDEDDGWTVVAKRVQPDRDGGESDSDEETSEEEYEQKPVVTKRGKREKI